MAIMPLNNTTKGDKYMRRREKASAFKMLFAVLAVLGIGVIWAANYTLAIDAATWLVNTHDFFLDIYTAISTDFEVLILIAGVIAVGYYYLVYRPNLRK